MTGVYTTINKKHLPHCHEPYRPKGATTTMCGNMTCNVRKSCGFRKGMQIINVAD